MPRANNRSQPLNLPPAATRRKPRRHSSLPAEPLTRTPAASSQTETAQACRPLRRKSAQHRPAAQPSILTADLGTPDDDFPVRLIYDGNLFVLINHSSRTFSIRGWTFAQHASFGDITFYASQWSTPLLGSVSPNTCYLIWRNTLSNVETPAYCDDREAWFAAGTRSRFWISAQPTADFEVFGSSGAQLGTCSISAGKCDLHAEN